MPGELSDALSREWEELAEHTGADPFRRPGWIAAWCEAFGKGSLDVITVRSDGRLAGALPILRRGGAASSPTNWHTPVFGAVAASDADVGALVRELLASRPHLVLLGFVDRTDPLLAALQREGSAAGYRTLESTALRSPYLELAGDWESCWSAIGSKRRNTLRRRRRRLEELGPLTLEVITGGDRLAELLDEALRVEALGWKGRRGSAIVSRPETRRFYTRVARWAAENGILRLAALRVADRFAAFDLALETASSHYLLKTGFDPALRDGAPGLVLRTMMIERAYSLDLDRYEFLGGEDPYKRDWTKTVNERARVQAFRPSIRGLGGWVAFNYGRRAARRAREMVRP